MFGAAVFEVADGEFDDGVVTVELVGLNGVEVVTVGDEGVVSPGGEQAGLGGVGESGAAHHQAHGATVLLAAASADVGGFGDLGVAADGVVDVDPGVIGDVRDPRLEPWRCW